MLFSANIKSQGIQLKQRRIDIWAIPLEKEPVWAKTLLDSAELARANRFYFLKHKRRFTIARAVLRLILAKYLKEDPKSIDFSYSNYGKPKLIHTPLEFNLSHSQDLALLAVGMEFPLGIDLEFFSKRPYEKIAQHVFSKVEYQDYLMLPKFLKPLAFFYLWAQKEAFIKACGLGLHYPINEISLPGFRSTHSPLYDLMHQTSWKVMSFMPHVNACAALCYHPTIDEINYEKFIIPDSLLTNLA